MLGSWMRRLVVGVGVVLAAVASASVAEAKKPNHSPPPKHVREIPFHFPVQLSDGQTYQMAAYLYVSYPVRHRTVQLLVHGATYNHLYWDTPDIDGHAYSYARDMARRGYVVISIDQLGTGASDKPDGDFFGLDEAARSLHQAASQVRAVSEGFCGPSAKLAYVGHSNGSVTSIYAQGTYGDADELVSTGWHHGFRGLPVDPTDPALGAVLANPYIGLGGPPRDALMYFLPSMNPDVIEYDHAHLNDVMPRHQFLDLIGVHIDITSQGPGGMTMATRSQQVSVPVLVQVGDHDELIAPAAAAQQPPGENAFFPSSPDFTLQTLSSIGHTFNLHTTNEQSWDGIDQWLDARE